MRAFRVLLTAVLVAGLSFGAAGCTDKDVAARVNGEVIKLSELNAQVDKVIEQYPTMFEGADGEGRLLDMKQRILDSLINSALIRQAAKERGINVSDADVDAKFAELKSGFADDEQFNAALEQAGMTVEELENQVREQLINEALMASLSEGDEITDEQIAEYYEANKNIFTDQAAVHAAHILFDEEDKETAEQVLAEVKAGGDFAALAKEHSKDPGSAAEGGDLGWPTMPFVPEFQAAADALAVGEISELVQSEFGWHIIKVLERREESVKPLEEVVDQVEQLIQRQRDTEAYQKYIDELREKAEIEILVPELQAPPAADADGGEGEAEESE